MQSLAKPDSPCVAPEAKERTTVPCTKSIKKALKLRAVSEERTLEEICVEALARYLGHSAAA